MTAYNLIEANKPQIENVANVVMEKKESYGDDLVRLLDAQHFNKPDIDWTADATWPNLMNWSKMDLPDRSLNGPATKARATKARATNGRPAKAKARSPRKQG